MMHLKLSTKRKNALIKLTDRLLVNKSIENYDRKMIYRLQKDLLNGKEF